MDPFLASLPVCDEGVRGQCVLYYGSKGYIVYEDFKDCQIAPVLFPGFPLLSTWLLGGIYILFMVYLFLGVSIASDVFVAAIEVIASKTKQVKKVDQNGNEVMVEVPVWNWVVANITLMSVGSSIPEIMLSLVETAVNLGKSPGELGAATIVGSGSFNLFIITAVCTLSLPDGSYRKIEQLRVFIFTAVSSIWAHIWLLIVYQYWSPNQITIAEAFITFGQFFVFVFIAWIVDTTPWRRRSNVVDVEPSASAQNNSSSKKDIVVNIEQQPAVTKSPLEDMLYQRRLLRRAMGLQTAPTYRQASILWHDISQQDIGANVQKIKFGATEYSVMESEQRVVVTVLREDGDLGSKLAINYKTKNGTAVDGLDYVASEGMLEFAPYEIEKEIYVDIVDDDLSEPDVTFWVVISMARNVENVVITQEQVEVTIVDDDEAGILSFVRPAYECSTEDPVMRVKVERLWIHSGVAQVDFTTVDNTAVAGKDYVETKGTLNFIAGCAEMWIEVPLVQPSKIMSGFKVFRIKLENPQWGAQLGKRTEVRIKIVAGKPPTQAPLGSMAREEPPRNELMERWLQGFRDALMSVEEDDDDDEGGGHDGGASDSGRSNKGQKNQPSWVAMILHYCSVTWKVICAFCPPPELWGGYPCFIASLMIISGIVYIMKEIGTTLGCALGLSQLMTGISIIAVGTSMPDTVASRMAAIKGTNADAAVGNINGSNTVNVFLGLGLPWVLATIYYQVTAGVPYQVDDSGLAWSVLLFCIFAVVVLTIVTCRGLFSGGELGGTRRAKWLVGSVCIAVWLLNLILVGLHDSDIIKVLQTGP